MTAKLKKRIRDAKNYFEGIGGIILFVLVTAIFIISIQELYKFMFF